MFVVITHLEASVQNDGLPSHSTHFSIRCITEVVTLLSMPLSFLIWSAASSMRRINSSLERDLVLYTTDFMSPKKEIHWC